MNYKKYKKLLDAVLLVRPKMSSGQFAKVVRELGDE